MQLINFLRSIFIFFFCYIKSLYNSVILFNNIHMEYYIRYGESPYVDKAMVRVLMDNAYRNVHRLDYKKPLFCSLPFW